MELRKLKRPGIVLAAIVLTGALAATAVAVLVGEAGGGQVRIDTRSENAATVSSAVAFNDVPGANVNVVVPAGTTRMIEASYTAESQCSGPGGGGWCTLRVIATNNATGVSVELRPETTAGLDYAFDSDQEGAAQDGFDRHAIDRSRRLAAGSYRIRLQRAVTNATIRCRLDDWHFAVRTDV